MGTIAPWHLRDSEVYHFREDCNRGGQNPRSPKRVDGAGQNRPCEESFLLLATEVRHRG